MTGDTSDPARPAAPLMSSQEVADLFDRTPRTIRNWVKAGHLRPRRVGGAVFFLRADIDQLLGIGVPDSANHG